jgi:CheY-like chemotaxis protein
MPFDSSDIKQTILIIDDIPLNITILGELLKTDYHVRAAVNGHDALAIACSETPPDLILLDVIMPGLD